MPKSNIKKPKLTISTKLEMILIPIINRLKITVSSGDILVIAIGDGIKKNIPIRTKLRSALIFIKFKFF